MIELTPEPLTAEAFAAFGEVISLDSAHQYPINQGYTTRFHDLMNLDVGSESGRPLVNVFRSRPLPMPHRVSMMERHPLGSQGFIAMDNEPFLVLVGSAKEQLEANDLHLFVTNGYQAINLYKNTWHHFQIVVGEQRDFLVLDRGGEGNNLQEIDITSDVWLPASIQNTIHQFKLTH